MSGTVLITGSSTGIGEATAWRFREGGWNVGASMRAPEKAGAWAREPGVFCPKLDVTDVGSIKAALAETRQRFGGLDAVVNNAGYGLVGPFEASDPGQVERQFAPTCSAS